MRNPMSISTDVKYACSIKLAKGSVKTLIPYDIHNDSSIMEKVKLKKQQE